MKLDKPAIEAAIKEKLVELVASTGDDSLADKAAMLDVDELIPASGLVDSAALLDLLAWYEETYDIQLRQEEITIDNLGTISCMVNFVLTRKGLA